MIKAEDFEIFKENISNLKETSKDNHDGTVLYMTNSTLEAINFDGVKDKYIEKMNLRENPRSNDALFFDPSGKLVFIEFKNGYMNRKKRFDVRGKIYDSLLIFTDITGTDIGYTRDNMDYILVYNQEKNPDDSIEEPERYIQESSSRDVISESVMALAGERQIKYGLERFKKYCIKDVYTYTTDEFQRCFVERISV